MARLGVWGKFAKKFNASPGGGGANTAISSSALAAAKGHAGSQGEHTRCSSATVAATYPSSAQMWAGRACSSVWLDTWLVKSS